jgi:hypothetical protein
MPGIPLLRRCSTPPLQRHQGDWAIFARTKEAKLNHPALLIEVQKLDIPVICLECGSYRLQDLFDLRLDGIRHENASMIECFEPVKKLGVFSRTSQRDGGILNVVEIGGPLAIYAR